LREEAQVVRQIAIALTVGLVVVTAGCGSDDSSSVVTGPASVAAAEARVTSAQTDLDAANSALTAAQEQFCTDATDYVTALDRYGKLFTDSKTTVGDVKTGGADLVAPKESVTTSAASIDSAQSGVAKAERDLADAQAALVEAQAAAASVPASATTAAPTTTTTLVPPATITRVKQAETDLAAATAGITDSTPLVEATVAYNSAAFALEVAWLKLLADAGCLTDAQQAEAVAQLTAYTAALQTDLQTAGYYKGPIDGIYGPQTVAAVEQLQTDSGLPVTGLVDQATALALDKKLGTVGLQTAALQGVLKLTGDFTGPIDGKWTPELTDALKQFQTASGLEPTGAVDAATLAALEQALAEIASTAATTTTTLPPSETTGAGATTASPESTEAPTTTAGGASTT
jgi:peptidoglycan hydrolase-like protein with peptidoglycan-binding domain